MKMHPLEAQGQIVDFQNKGMERGEQIQFEDKMPEKF